MRILISWPKSEEELLKKVKVLTGKSGFSKFVRRACRLLLEHKEEEGGEEAKSYHPRNWQIGYFYLQEYKVML